MAVPAGRRRLGPGSGHLVIRTRREGVAAKLGHDLTVEVTRWHADVDIPAGDGPDHMAGARITVEVDLGSLEIRDGTGGSAPLTDADRRDIRGNIRKALALDRYPTATYASGRILPESGTVDGTLSLHGAARPVRLRVTENGPDRYRGSATVTQSAFGIRPYSAFLGALRLRDDVEVAFEVDLSAAAPA